MNGFRNSDSFDSNSPAPRTLSPAPCVPPVKAQPANAPPASDQPESGRRASRLTVRTGGHRCARAFALLAAACSLLAAGCNRTPKYAGPPNLIIPVLMKKWVIVPNRIVVPQGAHVELIVRSGDIEHGIGVPALDINEPVQPGKPAYVRFLALRPGTYPMRCSILCGRGHDKMTGEIVITPGGGPPSPAPR